MMFALGCIQARHCNTDACPTGIATQNPKRYQALDVTDKGERVAKYHRSMIHHLVELLEVAGLERLEDIKPWHINRRINSSKVESYNEIYEALDESCLLKKETIPNNWKTIWEQASAEKWS
jgi:hypothetical protein